MKQLFLLFISVLSLGTYSQGVIKGKALNAEGYIIRCISPKDLISGMEQTIAIDTINSNGEFELSCNIGATRYGFIDIAFQRAEVFLTQRDTIEIVIDFDPDAMNRAYYDRDPLYYSHADPEDDNINRVIRSINNEYNNFILDHFNDIYKARRKYLIDTLNARLNRIMGNNPNKYVAGYVEYKLAALVQAARIMGKDKLGARYLTGRPVLYANIE